MLVDGGFGHDQPLLYPISEDFEVIENKDKIQKRIDRSRGLTEGKGGRAWRMGGERGRRK